MSRISFFGIIAMAAIVVISNILVQFLYGDWLTYGAFTYPFAFLVTDLVNRFEGATRARRVIIVGFLVGALCSALGSQIQGEFGPLVTLRIAMASALAFLSAQLVDVAVFDHLRAGKWWRAPVFSSVIGSSLDTLIFFSLAFSAQFVFLEPANDVAWANEIVPVLGVGPDAALWVSLAIADFGVKLLIALLALGPYRFALLRLKAAI